MRRHMVHESPLMPLYNEYFDYAFKLSPKHTCENREVEEQQTPRHGRCLCPGVPYVVAEPSLRRALPSSIGRLWALSSIKAILHSTDTRAMGDLSSGGKTDTTQKRSPCTPTHTNSHTIVAYPEHDVFTD